MTAQTRSAESAGGTPPATPPSPPGPRRSSWAASWRVSLRMARRDVRRHRGRSLVVLLMVGVPTMLICAGLVLGATSQISDSEMVPRLMGPAAATVDPPRSSPVIQGARPDSFMEEGAGGADARDIPGYDPQADVRVNADAIGELTGAEAVPWGEGSARAHVDDRLLRLRTLVLPGAERFPGKVDLVSGRWPAAPDEVLVSPEAVERGVPDSGSLTLTSADGDGTQSVTVVGTATALGKWSRYELVAPTAEVVVAGSDRGWYLLREEPVGWQQVRRLNSYGLSVASAQVLRDPPATSELDPRIATGAGLQDRENLTYVVLGGTLLLLTITLLVGPAFAVGAVRQRRTLALTASNGATSQQLRRTLLAQALVLGGLSALLGAVLSLPLAWGAVAALRERSTMGPFDVPWLQLAGIVTIALAAAIIAALVPAQRLTRLDIVSAMRGRVTSTPPSRLLLVLGAVIAAAGGAVVLQGTMRGASPFVLAGGAVALVLGTLLLVPTILHLLGRLAGVLPLPLRLAARDLARHRARSAPTVAAVLAGTAALTIGLVGATSDDEQARGQYVPSTLPGEVLLHLLDGDDAAVEAARSAVDSVAPQLVSAPLSRVGHTPAGPQEEPFWTDFVIVHSSECTAVRVVTGRAGFDQCQVVGGEMSNQQLAVLPAAEIVRRFELTGADAEAVRAGAALLLTSEHNDRLVDDGSVTLAHGQRLIDPEFYETTDTREVTETQLPVVTRPATKEALGRSASNALLVPAQTAEDEGWTTQVSALALHDPDGPISRETVERIDAARGGEGWTQLERGYTNPVAWVTAALLGIFTVLLLVVTLTSTALSLAEQSRDQATLAAVGAGRRTRRLMAGVQTLVLALVGVVLGVAVGIVPGIAIAMQLTSQGWDPVTGEMLTTGATIVIPWVALAVMVVAVPLLAGAIAAAGIRRAPDATHREQ